MTVLASVAVVLVLIVPIVALIIWSESRKDLEPSARAVLTIADPELAVSSPQDGSQLAILLTVVNTSDAAWRDVYLQVTFRDPTGAIVDAFVDRDYDLLIPPHSKIRTRIVRRAIKPLTEYRIPEVLLLSASPFKGY